MRTILKVLTIFGVGVIVGRFTDIDIKPKLPANAKSLETLSVTRGEPLKGLVYARGRLFILDESNKIYMSVTTTSNLMFIPE